MLCASVLRVPTRDFTSDDTQLLAPPMRKDKTFVSFLLRAPRTRLRSARSAAARAAVSLRATLSFLSSDTSSSAAKARICSVVSAMMPRCDGFAL